MKISERRESAPTDFLRFLSNRKNIFICLHLHIYLDFMRRGQHRAPEFTLRLFPKKYPYPLPFGKMTIPSAMLHWLAPVVHPPAEQDWSTLNSPEPEPTAPTTPPPPGKKRKRVSAVVDVHQLAKDGFVCCKRLRCVESFVLGNADIRCLRAEQKNLAGLTGAARSNFVHTMIPLVSPDKGAMLAGREYVCNSFFRKAFNVSNNMIQALKNNPGSPALKG